MARPRGTVIMKSTVHGLTEIDSASVIVNEITLVGSRCGRFEPALRLLRSGKVKVEGLISEMLPLKDARAAFRRAGTAGVLKVLLHA
jgi:alcohol dehydrogenase